LEKSFFLKIRHNKIEKKIIKSLASFFAVTFCGQALGWIWNMMKRGEDLWKDRF
jgi:hypothetical protein